MAKYNKLINTKQIFIHFFLKNNLSEQKNNHTFGITYFLKIKPNRKWENSKTT